MKRRIGPRRAAGPSGRAAPAGRARPWRAPLARAAAAALLLWGAACTEPVREVPRPPAAAACPSTRFPEFVRAFADSTPLQAAFTRFPLETLRLVDADPDPLPLVERMDRARAEFPLVPGPAERSAAGLLIQADEADGDSADAVLFKPDTDYKVVYRFRRDGCWTLTRIENWSL